jgi:hypothetical protein
MSGNIKKLKPGADRSVHLLLAAMLWTIIGAGLLYRGVALLRGESLFYYAAVGVLGGTLKSLLVLDRVSRKGIERIKRFADNTCIGAVYSWKTWLLVFSMAVFGILFRKIDMAAFKGTVCVAIGWALIFSSRLAWKSWMTWNQKSKDDDTIIRK